MLLYYLFVFILLTKQRVVAISVRSSPPERPDMLNKTKQTLADARVLHATMKGKSFVPIKRDPSYSASKNVTQCLPEAWIRTDDGWVSN